MRTHLPTNLSAVLAALVLLVGCERSRPIVEYSIPTAMPEELEPARPRMLAAMVPRADENWFFKVVGPRDAVDTIEPTFRAFVQEVDFEGGVPDLEDLPSGWRRAGEKPMRYASIDIPTKRKQLDLSISRLPRQEDWDQEVGMNVNRWRDQVGLEPSEEKWAGAEPLEVAASEQTGVWVDLVGEAGAQSTSMTPPFAGGAGAMPGGGLAGGAVAAGGGETPPVGAAAPPAAISSGSPGGTSPPRGASGGGFDLDYEMPEAWRPGRKSMMRLAAFNVGPEESPAEVTVIPASGDLRANVARWLGQIRDGKVPDDVVDEAMAEAETVEVDGRQGQRFLLTAEQPASGLAIDATVIPLQGGRSLFIKMTGPHAVVAQQEEAMRSFLSSLEW